MSAELSFGQLLKKYREEKGLTQQGLGEMTAGQSKDGKLSRVQIARLEGGDQSPSWDTVKALCKALGIDCTAFADTAGEAPAKKESKVKYEPEVPQAPKKRVRPKKEKR